MDKETLSNYGWIVICVLVLAVMLALATPFGNFIADGFKAAFLGFGQTNNSMLDTMFDATGTPPSLEYLQSKYQFEYYSTMNLAVTDVNNGTVGASADVDKEDAVAGIYTDENGGVNVVLLQDTTEATTISPAVDMTINLGGHVLSSTDTVGVNITAGNVAIDGRLNGSTIQLNHTQSTSARTIVVDAGANLTIDSGTYICSTEGDNSRCILSYGNLTLTNAVVIGTETTGTFRAIQVQGDNTTISNSFITATSNEGVPMGVAVAGPTTISGCSITAATKNGEADGVYTWAQANTATISNCTINTTTNYGKTYSVVLACSATVSNCSIYAGADNGKAFGVTNTGSATVSDCTINAYANYGNDGSDYLFYSNGVQNAGTLTLNDCYVMGVHSGVESIGTLYVNGGTFEGYGHGGFYFGGTGVTSYVRNATIRECPMPDGYTGTAGDNNAGFYIGGNAGRDNISVYMDNCDIYGSSQPIVLRGSEGEQNNSLYISNSKINTDRNIRIDNDTHKLYIGAGNNFTADNTGRPSAVITTNETYTQN